MSIYPASDSITAPTTINIPFSNVVDIKLSISYFSKIYNISPRVAAPHKTLLLPKNILTLIIYTYLFYLRRHINLMVRIFYNIETPVILRIYNLI